MASARIVGRSPPGGATTSPRSTAARSTAWRFTAVRCPADARSTARPCTWSPRTLDPTPRGYTSSRSSTERTPAVSVPVTTVPKPRTVNTRSMGSRGVWSVDLAGTDRASSASAARSSSSPVPALIDTGTMGQPPRNVGASRLLTSSRTSSIQSGSARSVLVRATSPDLMRRSEQIARCSRVWGITPSSAAITSMTRSMPPTPASMFLTKRSWPGTSTISMVAPPGSSRKAKPRSMVIPRAFSSGRRSVSVPVSALTSEVLPWSMCPAVPTTTCFMRAR